MDSVKTFLIFMVILGHVIAPYGSGTLNDVNLFVEMIIFSFHMPLFVMISGYFCHYDVKFSSFVKRLLEVFATFLVFQTIRVLISQDYSLTAILTPKYTLWYLLCLVYWRIFVYLLAKRLPWGVILAISIAISLGAGFLPYKILSFQRACAFLPFFVFGTMMREYDITPKIDRIKPGVALAAVIVSLVILVFMENAIGVNMKKDILIAKTMYADSLGIIWRSVWLILASVISLGVYRLVPDTPKLARFGSATLTIYVFHSFFTKQFPYILDATPIPNDLLVNVVYSALVFAVCVLLSKSRIVSYIVKPLRLSK